MQENEERQPVVEREEKVLVITRRLFPGDARRHFAGSVERCDGGALRVRGYAFVYDVEKGGFVRRKSQRTRIFPLDNHLIILVLPYDADLGMIHYEHDPELGLVATDGKHFKLELAEFQT